MRFYFLADDCVWEPYVVLEKCRHMEHDLNSIKLSIHGVLAIKGICITVIWKLGHIEIEVKRSL